MGSKTAAQTVPRWQFLTPPNTELNSVIASRFACTHRRTSHTLPHDYERPKAVEQKSGPISAISEILTTVANLTVVSIDQIIAGDWLSPAERGRAFEDALFARTRDRVTSRPRHRQIIPMVDAQIWRPLSKYTGDLTIGRSYNTTA
jgi:hypothetical protein